MYLNSFCKSILFFMLVEWACGATDNASDYGSEDSRFESWQARTNFAIFHIFEVFLMNFRLYILCEQLLFFLVLINITKMNNNE